MATEHVNIRYMVDDVQQAVDWYTKHLGFRLLSTLSAARCGCC
jgi:catechol 2,3-dioxygenase-like lactoylglutathione lyase family enzyme